MTFAERLKTKMTVDRWTRQVLDSLKPVDNYRRLDKEALRSLLDMAGYQSRLIRDVEVYALDFDSPHPEVLVLDSELKFFHTSLNDIALRKAPLLKEMVKLSGIIKILTDSAVVGVRGAESVHKIRRQILAGLDLSFTPADIEAISDEGCRALQEQDMARVEEAMALFSELLGLIRLSSPLPQTSLWGQTVAPSQDRTADDQQTYHQIILVGPVDILSRYLTPMDADQLKQSATILELMAGNPEPREEGQAVFEALRQEVLASGKTRITP